MNRERLFKHLEDHYIPKREMISRIPLGVQPDEFWQDVQNRRRARSISLQLHIGGPEASACSSIIPGEYRTGTLLQTR